MWSVIIALAIANAISELLMLLLLLVMMMIFFGAARLCPTLSDRLSNLNHRNTSWWSLLGVWPTLTDGRRKTYNQRALALQTLQALLHLVALESQGTVGKARGEVAICKLLGGTAYWALRAVRMRYSC